MSASLTDVRRFLTRYFMSSYMALGIVGCIFNVLVFRRKEFLKNSCSRYLLAAACLNVFTIGWGVIPALYTLDNPDPSNNSYIYCKLRHYTAHTMLMISRTLIVLACFDRFCLCSGSLRLRIFTKPKMANLLIMITFFIWPILTCHLAIMSTFTGTQCVYTQPYSLINSIYVTIAAGIWPPCSMAIFSVFTVTHRRNLQQRLNGGRKENKRDTALIIMLISEVIVYVTTTCLYPAITLYITIKTIQDNNAARTPIELFLNYMGSSFLVFINPSASFYIYLFSSKSYRKEVKLVLRNYLFRFMGRKTIRIDPGNTQINDSIQNNASTMT